VSRVLVPRLLATSSLITAATAARLGAGGVGLVAGRTPSLLRLAAAASAGQADAARAQAAFRDELIALWRDAAELSWLELRRGLDALDASTRPDDGAPARIYRRPYKVKA
jgi:hypothetical protein